jgi:dihydrofolate synthase/folylpolyglutamate synthase
VELPLLGSHQQINAAVALAALPVLVGEGFSLDREAVLRGLREVRWPGRFEIIKRKPVVIADGAHNVDSMSKLHHTITQLFHRWEVVVVLGVARDKDLAGIVEEIGGWTEHVLGPRVERLLVTRSGHPRSTDPQELAALAARHSLPTEIEPSVAAALGRAEELARARTDAGRPTLVLVTGSLFIVAEAREEYALAQGLIGG